MTTAAKPRPARVLITLASTALAASVALLAACEHKPSTPPGPAKPKATAWVAPLAMGPISYFNAQCVSCHGTYGSQITDHNIARNSTNAAYRGMVEYMVTERAGSKLPPRDMAAEASYCLSLAAASEGVPTAGSPLFVCIKDPINTGGLEGEVTPGCTVTLVTAKGEVRTEATVSGHTWSIAPQQVANAKSGAGDDWVNATIDVRNPTASGAAARQTLQLSEAAFIGPKLIDPPPPPPPPPASAPAPNQKP